MDESQYVYHKKYICHHYTYTRDKEGKKETHHAELAGILGVGDDLVGHAVALLVQGHRHLALCCVMIVYMLDLYVHVIYRYMGRGVR